jgi:Zn-dependent peptidase ImmA (M78 family)
MIEVASEERADLGLGPDDRLNPYALASLHAIPVYPIDELDDEVRAVVAIKRFTTTGQSLWSAALIPVGNGRLIIENTAHLAVRRMSSIAHELAHHLLEHSFDEILLNAEKKCRQFDRVKEGQAQFLSGELLIPRKAARKAAFAGGTNEDVAERFGVSTQFAQMQMAGPRKFAERALAKQAAARRALKAL